MHAIQPIIYWTYGVPHGSSWSHLLFMKYLEEIIQTIKVGCHQHMTHQYIDDTIF